MEIFFIVVSILYFLIHIVLFRGLRKSFSLNILPGTVYPKVSVIVAARNEEDNILKCIESLAEINYPEELLEIILVNDKSDDRTFEIMKNSERLHPSFKVINSHKNESPNLKGKANAIDNAVDISTGDIILMTDADCTVNPEWVKNTVRYYIPGTGMVCGFTLMNDRKSLFSVLQSADWLYLLSLASSSAGLNSILSCIGNNLSFSKEAYRFTGGYKLIKFSVTEDLALMRKINSGKNFRVSFPVDKNCLVYTNPCRSIQEVFSQKRRWFRGGTGINFLGYITGAELYLMNFLLVSGLFFLNLKLYLFLICIKIISELILLHKPVKEFGLTSFYFYYPLFMIYFAFTGLLLPWTFLAGSKIKWKGRKF
ncbi:MAG: glycosyltransferase [Ignavibacteria bacterium]|nr:glycosyltransferase [Ignavibacteria bacterium]